MYNLIALWFFLFFPILTFAQTAHGTFVLLYARNGEAYLAADSRATNSYDGNSADIACKIMLSHNKAIGFSGIIYDLGTNFNFRKEFIACLNIYPDSTIKFIIQALEHRLADVVWKSMRDTTEGIGIIGCNALGKRFIVTGCDILPKDAFSILKHNEHIEIRVDTFREALVTSGFNEAAQKIQNEWERDSVINPITIINDVFKQQAIITPKYVGGATDIVRIDSIGLHWICKKQNCE